MGFIFIYFFLRIDELISSMKDKDQEIAELHKSIENASLLENAQKVNEFV